MKDSMVISMPINPEYDGSNAISSGKFVVSDAFGNDEEVKVWLYLKWNGNYVDLAEIVNQHI